MNNLIGKIFYYRNVPHDKMKLVSIGKCTYHFECGHWCTDSVFADLLPCEPIQLKLF